MTQTEKQATHTPGPWHAERLPYQDRSAEFWPWMIHTTEGEERLFIMTDRWDQRAQADARLIAAAPELLEALRASQPILVVAQHEANKRRDNEMAERCSATCDLIESALAKATTD